MPKRNILVTSALPYANGPIHLGHLVEYIGTDIYVRYQKLKGHNCHYICADDTHGTPIMISAKAQNITPEELIEKSQKDHLKDFQDFGIEFSHYDSTNSPQNQALAEEIYIKAKENGAITEKEIEQAYCNHDKMFLPDRFIKGTCPKCDTPDQYGDSCEHCSATYSPTDLKDPKCTLCDNPPSKKTSLHHFFKLANFESQLQDWLKGDQLRDELKNKLKEWFKDGLKDWDISRDAPYFGFKIPGTDDKYFYVWLDAPVGYIAATQNFCKTAPDNFEEIWKTGNYEIHHFIGKDILYFHALFWPAMLMTSGFKLPNKINVHGFLTVNGEKMSKSRGTFILAKKYLETLPPEYLRYYYAAKLSGSVDDIDLNLEDFTLKINSELIGKLINIASRTASILVKKCDATLTEPDEEGQEILKTLSAQIPEIDKNYDSLNTQKAIKLILNQAEIVNKYINDQEPWTLVKENPDAAAKICTTALNAFSLLSTLLKPILPELAKSVESFLNLPPQPWPSQDTPIITKHKINPYTHLASRLEQDLVNQIKNKPLDNG